MGDGTTIQDLIQFGIDCDYFSPDTQFAFPLDNVSLRPERRLQTYMFELLKQYWPAKAAEMSRHGPVSHTDARGRFLHDGNPESKQGALDLWNLISRDEATPHASILLLPPELLQSKIKITSLIVRNETRASVYGRDDWNNQWSLHLGIWHPTPEQLVATKRPDRLF